MPLLSINQEMRAGINKRLEEFCENLPFNFTFFEKEGQCTRKSEICKYCYREGDDYKCKKDSSISSGQSIARLRYDFRNSVLKNLSF